MSPVTRAYLDRKLALAKRCSREATLDGAKAAVVATVAISAVPTLEQKLARAKQCSHEAAIAGLRAAAATAVCTAIPTFASVRMSKWARANLGNPVAQTVIISYAAGMAYFIAGEKKVVELSRKHSLETAKDTSFKG